MGEFTYSRPRLVKAVGRDGGDFALEGADSTSDAVGGGGWSESGGSYLELDDEWQTVWLDRLPMDATELRELHLAMNVRVSTEQKAFTIEDVLKAKPSETEIGDGTTFRFMGAEATGGMIVVKGAIRGAEAMYVGENMDTEITGEDGGMTLMSMGNTRSTYSTGEMEWERSFRSFDNDLDLKSGTFNLSVKCPSTYLEKEYIFVLRNVDLAIK